MRASVEAALLCFIFFQVKGDSCPYDGDLTATSKPSLTIFNQTLSEPYDRIFGSPIAGLECTWTIEALDADKVVRLRFKAFHLINTTVSKRGDCVAIYDGDEYDTDADHLIQELCDRLPEGVYNSTGRSLSIVFRQGQQGGRRWISMNYTEVTDPDSERSRFWSTTFGRVLSFIIVIAIFSVFSFIFKAWRQGSVHETCRGCCDILRHLLRPLRRLGSRCADLFKSRAGSAETASSRGEPSQRRSSLVLRRTSSTADNAVTDIVTISGSNSTGPNLSSIFTGQGSNMGEAPPDYSTVLAHSASSSTSSERSDSLRPDDDAVPDYESAVSSSFHLDSQDPSHDPSLHPPPDDGSAPPSYELPAPPSYDSLFTGTNA